MAKKLTSYFIRIMNQRKKFKVLIDILSLKSSLYKLLFLMIEFVKKSISFTTFYIPNHQIQKDNFLSNRCSKYLV